MEGQSRSDVAEDVATRRGKDGSGVERELSTDPPRKIRHCFKGGLHRCSSVDEIDGQSLTYLVAMPFVPLQSPIHLAVFALAGVLLYRFFDILKPWPIRAFERLPGGIGIVADDLAAGYFAAAVLAIGWRLLS